jgi:hypothetical protein
MALAILRYLGTEGSQSRFQVDIGTNRFYTYAIGTAERRSNHGLDLLNAPSYRSPLIGPLPDSSLGRTILEIPNDRFDTQHRFIQITSFRNEQRFGPAISEIVQGPVLSLSPVSAVPPSAKIPVQSFSMEAAEEMYSDHSISFSSQEVYTVPFAYQEEKPVSSAMFLGALTSLIPKVLPVVSQVLPVVSGLVGGGAAPAAGAVAIPGTIAPGSQPGAEGPASFLQTVTNPDTLNLIQMLLQQVAAQPATGSANLPMPAVGAPPLPSLTAPPQNRGSLPPPPPTAPPQARGVAPAARPLPPPPVAAATRTTPAAGRQVSRARSFDGTTLLEDTETVSAFSEPSQYVHEMAIPAMLMQALPALMPVVEKVLNPETLRTLMDNMPVNKVLGTVTEGLKQVTGMIQQSEQRTREHIEKIMPEAINQQEVTNLFQNLSLGLARGNSKLNYQRVEAVRLKFQDLTMLKLNGRSRLIYLRDRGIAFPLKITTPRPIPAGTLHLMVKNPVTLEVLIDQQYSVGEVTSGALKVLPKLSREELRRLPANEEYLICLYLVWSGKSKQTQQSIKLGTSVTQLMTLVGEYCFDRIEGPAEVVSLNDVKKFRPYWHKIWEGGFAEATREIRFDCKYYYTLEKDRINNARMETVTKMVKTEKAEQLGKLKSGVIFSPHELNALINHISPYPTLDDFQLRALLSSEFKTRFQQAASSQVKFQNNGGEKVALWVYPEFKLQQVMLKKVERTNEAGHVLELSEKPVRFPIPAVAHLIGAGT